MNAKDRRKFLRQLGRRIDSIRKAQKLSYGELAYRAEVDKGSLVNNIKKGRNITVVTLQKIANGLDVPVSSLLEFDKKVNRK